MPCGQKLLLLLTSVRAWGKGLRSWKYCSPLLKPRLPNKNYMAFQSRKATRVGIPIFNFNTNEKHSYHPLLAFAQFAYYRHDSGQTGKNRKIGRNRAAGSKNERPGGEDLEITQNPNENIV